MLWRSWGRRIETAVLLLLPVFVAVRMFTDIPLLLRNLTTNCWPRICLRGNLFTNHCLAMDIHVTLCLPIFWIMSCLAIIIWLKIILIETSFEILTCKQLFAQSHIAQCNFGTWELFNLVKRSKNSRIITVGLPLLWQPFVSPQFNHFTVYETCSITSWCYYDNEVHRSPLQNAGIAISYL
jgi:hypothetical protein